MDPMDFTSHLQAKQALTDSLRQSENDPHLKRWLNPEAEPFHFKPSPVLGLGEVITGDPERKGPIYEHTSPKHFPDSKSSPQTSLIGKESKCQIPCIPNTSIDLQKFYNPENNEMDLGFQKWQQIPPTLFNWSGITVLDLSHNGLTQIPPEIGKLRKLRRLDLSHNVLQSLPVELGMLVDLRSLNLYHNRITSLPYQLGSLRRLASLPLDHNPLIPEQRAVYRKDDPQALIGYLLKQAPELQAPNPRKTIELIHTTKMDASDKISVLSYNTLNPNSAAPERYSSVSPKVLTWETRREAILGEIEEQSSDVVCLQEIDTESCYGFWTPRMQRLGYLGVFSPRARKFGRSERNQLDGCATFYREARFLLLDTRTVDLAEEAIRRRDIEDSQYNVRYRVDRTDNIAVVTFLQNRLTGARILVANTHLVANPTYSDVKVIQALVLAHRLGNLADEYANWPPCNYGALDRIAVDGAPVVEFSFIAQSQLYPDSTDLPIILAGDFNSLPDSAVFQLLSSGCVEPTHPDFRGYSYGWLTSQTIRQPLQLGSAYDGIDEPLFSIYTPLLKGTIDYIWHTVGSTRVSRLLGPADEAYTKTVPGFPSKHFPSDHIKLVAEFVVERKAHDITSDSESMEEMRMRWMM